MERVRNSDQEKLSLCERTNEELSAEKAHLEQLLKKVEEQQEGLQVELRILAEEKAETQEQLSQVRPNTWCFRGGLLAARLSEAQSVGSCGGFVKETLGSAGGQKLCLLPFGNVLVAGRAVLQFSQLSSAATDDFNPPACGGLFFGF